eukprot:11540153-Alexandrium_andersonii.AAC.1
MDKTVGKGEAHNIYISGAGIGEAGLLSNESLGITSGPSSSSGAPMPVPSSQRDSEALVAS